MSDITDAHWFPLASQGNVYSMTKLCSPNGINKILVASLKRQIYLCEYQETENHRLRPIVKELLFTYIPSGAEVISIDAYNKSNTADEFVIGVTIIKPNNERYLNIYTEGAIDGDDEASSSIEAIAQNCLMVELPYTPYHLYHTFIPLENGTEAVWLISGSDYKIHVIIEDKNTHGYAETRLEKYFPELEDLQSIALWIDIYYIDNYKRRVTAVGCECGLVKITLMNTKTLQPEKSWMLRYDTPITSVRVFPDKNNIPLPECIDKKHNSNEIELILNVLVVNINSAVVFADVLKCGLEKDVILNDGEAVDGFLCSCVADVNMNGLNEIILGTYSQEILIYSLINDTWSLTSKRLMDAPVHSISYLDLTGDGMKELICLTQRGLHILQHNPKNARKKLKKRFDELVEMLKG